MVQTTNHSIDVAAPLATPGAPTAPKLAAGRANFSRAVSSPGEVGRTWVGGWNVGEILEKSWRNFGEMLGKFWIKFGEMVGKMSGKIV